MSLLERLEVPEAKSRASSSATDSPRLAAGALGELVAEFLGTAIIILFGTGSVAMSVAALNRSERGTEAFHRPAATRC